MLAQGQGGDNIHQGERGPHRKIDFPHRQEQHHPDSQDSITRSLSRYLHQVSRPQEMVTRAYPKQETNGKQGHHHSNFIERAEPMPTCVSFPWHATDHTGFLFPFAPGLGAGACVQLGIGAWSPFSIHRNWPLIAAAWSDTNRTTAWAAFWG